ncbi:potassium transporter Kup [Solirubrobacter ginsenosidimutans]|uniref:Probable potassium transport system protein Kup n=1 Tax=Solirubrobacter ginsenosidimutans TaxID=490573 RepID=A0A9X3S9M2_9ACTN|nr:potassium transporter Kup [Solirubrobacter ginsenosidimutans]MDA0165163.1 potassium transporter Kup [Solirubrobacter ginsenosidimutans]
MNRPGGKQAAVVLGAIGVVFGDIGTSPLYTLRTVFAPEHGLDPSREAVFGVVSLIFWAITVIVSVKYVTFIMRADNDGEGGIMALIALIQRANLRSRGAQIALVLLGVFGASLFYGDGMITPAISVLSAVEGLEVVNASLKELVIPITLVVLAVLFFAQRFGTGAVGRFFGPIMVTWFGVLALIGLIRALQHPEIFGALSPHHGAEFLFNHGHEAFVALGGVVLAVTGAEALYADMGHFGAHAIRKGWFALVFPALILNYLGQGGLILSDPAAAASPFFLLFPPWARIPMVLLSTVAAIIASQAVISGAFSVTRQAIRLGFLPRLSVRHTSKEEVGQVYVPAVNWIIFAAVVALVVGFGSSEKLASAYGIAVTGTLAIDTLLFFFVVRAMWHRPMWLVIAGAGAFLTVDLTFFAANLTKVVHGGWFPLAIALVVFSVLTTWQRGREIITTRRVEEEGPLRRFVDEVREIEPPVARVPGTAVFLNANPETTPLALRANVKHNHVLHDCVLIVSLTTERVPYVHENERLSIDDLGYRDDGITHITGRFGFQDPLNVPALMRQAAARGVEGNPQLDDPSYFVSKIQIIPSDRPGMAKWRKKLFLAISRNAANPVEVFHLPDERTVVMGSHIEL